MARVFEQYPWEGHAANFGPHENRLGDDYGIGLGVEQQAETGAHYGDLVRADFADGTSLIRRVNETSERPAGVEFFASSQGQYDQHGPATVTKLGDGGVEEPKEEPGLYVPHTEAEYEEMYGPGGEYGVPVDQVDPQYNKPVIDEDDDPISPSNMTRRIRQQYSAQYGSVSDDKLWSAFSQKYDTPMKQLRALYPEYKDQDDGAFAGAIKDRYYPKDTDKEFQDRINPPTGISGIYQHFTEQWPNLIKGWYQGTSELAKFPDRLIQKVDDANRALGIAKYPNEQGPKTELYRWAQAQAKRGQAWEKNARIPDPKGIAGATGQHFFEAIGESPEIAPAFIPGGEGAGAVAALVFGMGYDGIQAEGRARELQLDHPLVLGTEAAGYRFLQDWFLRTPRGRLLSGLLMGAGSVGDAEAQKFISGEKPNTLNDLIATAAVNGLFGAIFSAGPEKLPSAAKEVFFDAVEQRRKGNYDQAGQLLDKTMALLPDDQRKAIANNLLAWRNDAIPALENERPLELTYRRGFKVIKQGGPPEPSGEAITAYPPEKTSELTPSPSSSALTIKEDPANDSFYVLRNGEQEARFNTRGKAQNYIDSEQVPKTSPIDSATDQFYFGIGDPLRVIETALPSIRSKISGTLKGKGLADPEFWRDITVPESGGKEREISASVIGKEIGRKQTDQRRMFDTWMRQQKLEKDLRFAYESDQRRAFWLNFSKGKLMTMAENWESARSTGNKVADRLIQLHKGIGRAIGRMDESNGLFHNMREDYLPHILQNEADIPRAEEMMRRMKWGDPNFMKARKVPDAVILHALGFRLKTYNFEDLMQMRLDMSLYGRLKANVLEGLHEAKLAWTDEDFTQLEGEILAKVRSSGKAVSKERIAEIVNGLKEEIKSQCAPQVWRSPRRAKRGDMAETYWVHKDADFMLHRALDPLGKLRIWLAPLQAIKQRTVGLNLGLSGYHHLHMLTIGGADTMSLALEKWMNGTGKMSDWRDALADVFTTGAYTHVKSLNYNQRLLNWYAAQTPPTLGERAQSALHLQWAQSKAPPSLADLSPFERESLELQVAGGFTPHLSQERQIQFMRNILGRITPHARLADKALDIGYRILSGKPYQNWLFSRAIPSLKMYSYDRYARALMDVHPEYARPNWRVQRDNELHKIRDQVDDRFGERNLEQDFTHKWIKGIGQAVMLSYSWFRSFLGVYGGAAIDLSHIATHMDQVTKTWRTEGAKAAAQRFVTQRIIYGTSLTAATAMVAGLISATIGVGIKSLQDLIYPNVGYEPDGKTLKRVKPPFWTTTEFGGLMHDIELAQGNPVMGLATFFMNKAQPALSTIVHAYITNKDYAGRDISPQWDPSKDWWSNFVEQQWTKAEYDLTQGAPFILQQQVFQKKPGTTWKDALLNIVGLPPAPKYAERTHIENLIVDTYINYHTMRGKEREAADQTNARANYRSALQTGDQESADYWKSEMKRLKMSDKSISNVEKTKDQTEAEGVFHLLSAAEQLRILQQAKGEEREHFFHLAKQEVQSDMQ